MDKQNKNPEKPSKLREFLEDLIGEIIGEAFFSFLGEMLFYSFTLGAIAWILIAWGSIITIIPVIFLIGVFIVWLIRSIN